MLDFCFFKLVSCFSLACTRYIPLAIKRNGMQAVAETDFFATHLQQHPAHRQSLLATHPATFAVRSQRKMIYSSIGAVVSYFHSTMFIVTMVFLFEGENGDEC